MSDYVVMKDSTGKALTRNGKLLMHPPVIRGTDCFVGGQRQDRLDFTSDPQTQLDENKTGLTTLANKVETNTSEIGNRLKGKNFNIQQVTEITPEDRIYTIIYTGQIAINQFIIKDSQGTELFKNSAHRISYIAGYKDGNVLNLNILDTENNFTYNSIRTSQSDRQFTFSIGPYGNFYIL